MKFIYLISISLILLIFGCYDDKGNYDYTPINRIEIESFTIGTQYLGDTIEIKPILNFAIDSTENNLVFEWTVFDTKKFHMHDLFYITDTLGSGFIILRVKDTIKNIEYSQFTSITIKTEYEAEGYVILSKGNNNASHLSYIRLTTNANYTKEGEEHETNYYDCKDYYNVYEATNKESMGRGPLKLLQHFHSSNSENGSEVGAFWIFQEEPECIDISGVSFQKDITLRSQFLDGMPADFHPYDMVDMRWSSFVIGKDGKMYSRKKATEFLFNSGHFLNNAVTFEEEGNIHEVSGAGVLHHRYSTGGYTLLYEKNLHRFLLMLDGNQQVGGGIAAPFVSGNSIYTPADAARIDDLGEMEMIYCGAYKSNYWAVSNYYYAILKDPKGIYYSYVFGINNTNYGEAPTITGVTQKALPDETQVLLNNILTGTNKNLFEIGAGDNAVGFQAPNGKERINYILITRDNELWLLDRSTGLLELYDTFDATITALDTEVYNSWLAGIGLENGKFHIIEITDAAYGGEHPKRMYSSENNFGEIVDIRYKSGSSW